ncbi:GlxA family transcriptional regulator [Prosthecodimorpha staleyi]|uniref:Helix-turn-helix domain-containing protein n=1 Tax=Prosthecodimorpha staleyi TaxID=2840188 RepID=A0A947D6U2_9HYPH|nr:helix-turn-helix domain-containing protein [Prosthecodimorpha staleyi]MBT9292153.1 helix-turn-helix domain-containing protein [Prosthecodimorpha staleyi]
MTDEQAPATTKAPAGLSGLTGIVPVVAVVPPRVLLLDLAGPIEVLRKANLEQEAVRFEVTYVAPGGTAGSSIGLDLAGLAPLPDRLAPGTILIVPGSTEVPLRGVRPGEDRDGAAEREIVRWLARVAKQAGVAAPGGRTEQAGAADPDVFGIRLVSICSGALLAARAGLLEGRDCTTHHACLDELARLAPTARVRENRLFVDDGDVLTSAGITAGIDLMLHLVARIAGPAVALSVARYLVVYLRRTGQDPQLSPWLEGRNHIHPAVHRAQDAVAAEPARDWSVASLARVAGTSPRNLSRLFNEHAGSSVTDYVNRIRLALARDLLAGSRLDMETVAERAGFGSTRQLRRAWGRVHDAPPSRMRGE